MVSCRLLENRKDVCMRVIKDKAVSVVGIDIRDHVIDQNGDGLAEHLGVSPVSLDRRPWYDDTLYSYFLVLHTVCAVFPHYPDVPGTR